ncbi:MAG: hypothetical protein AseanaTS_21890 [Candidatus Pelagadaptatus aseana]|uniref:hypothetical protein n=1 Tax=Candidatus Pelagadaptatus aseana TaxID=3120508 RepID=UPI0039B242A8
MTKHVISGIVFCIGVLFIVVGLLVGDASLSNLPFIGLMICIVAAYIASIGSKKEAKGLKKRHYDNFPGGGYSGE